MTQIKFSHIYNKLLDSHDDVIGKATLLQVIPIKLEDLSADFIDYDTDYGTYQLPVKGEYMMLIFLKPSFGCPNLNLFTTLRRWTPEKYRYYLEKVGKIFEVVLE